MPEEKVLKQLMESPAGRQLIKRYYAKINYQEYRKRKLAWQKEYNKRGRK